MSRRLNYTRKVVCYDGYVLLFQYIHQVISLRYIGSEEEQIRILKACHVEVTAGHMGIKNCWENNRTIYLAWRHKRCKKLGKVIRGM